MQEFYSIQTKKSTIYYSNLPDVLEKIKINGREISYILHYLGSEVIGSIDVNVVRELLEKV